MGLLGLLSSLHSAFFRDQALQELKMTSSVASYEQLVRQVEALKAENNHLRQELRDNSSHLSKLETETSGMKEVLKHLQCKLEQEARVLVSSGQTEVLEQLKALQMDITSLYNLKFQPPALGPEPAARTPEGSPVHGSGTCKDSFGELSRATIRLLEELDRERCFLLNEIEKEEKEKLWYYSQLQGLSKRLDELPHVETFSMQMDLIRQQLEFESQHIRSLMEERFGTSDEMVQRAQIRASRLEQIDKELLSAQDRVQQTEPQALLAVKSVPVDEDPETKIPMHPEDSAPQPGNSKEYLVTPVERAFGPRGLGASPVTEAPHPSPQVEVVFWLLSMLATRDQEDTARTLLAMSSSPESCVAMRRSGCLPLLLQILHGTEAGAGGRNGASGAPGAKDARMHANAALHNIIFSQPDQGLARKEMRVLHVLEQIRAYCETCWDWLQAQDGESEGSRVGQAPVPIEPQICQATCAVMKLSFDEEYRRAMNELGGLQAVAELLQVDYEMYKMTRDPLNLALRRYAGMTLTNLTFGDVANKATLCARRGSMEAIVAQLASESEDLQQVVSSILRNLSWRADINSKKVLREVGSMTALMQCVLRASKESTLKSVLSALWNLSAHSTENKAAICQVDGALGFLVSTLTYKCQSNSLAIIESGGGILRNVSSLIATREDYRQVLRDHNCLQTLLQHLTSHSLTIVSNACGTLWNLSARSPRDQELLWDLGAVAMLRNLVHSKHKMIAMGSAAALRNLLAHRPAKYQAAATAISPSACVPSLYVRKQRALEAELDARHLAQALDHLEKQDLPEAEAEAASKKPLPPLRHLDGLAQDYASDSGCFDDDDVPSLAAVAATAEPASPTVLSLFLGSSFLQGQALARAPPAHRSGPEVEKEASGEAALAARAKAKLALAVARIDRLVEDISALHTSSDDSFSLSSGDPGQEVPREGRAQSYSPCWGPEGGQREAGSRAHPLLRLKAAHASLSNDSLNSGSTSDGHCPRDHTRPLASLAEHREGPPCGQVRPSQLDLNLLDGQAKPAAREAAATDACVRTIKLSPTYQHVPLLEDTTKAGVGLLVPGSRKQAWLPAEGVSKVAEKLVVEAAPLCLSRCSSLSSLSSAGRPGPSEAGDLNDSDSSLEGLEEASPSEAELDRAWHGPGDTSLPMAIPAPPPGRSLGVEDATPSSSSENCVQETPLVLSRCSSVSSLGSFESPSIASSIPSDPCSGLGSGTVSPSELPDSPGQTMPPSRSKTPPTAPAPPGEREATQFSLQWESYVKRFLDIADCRERCWLPSELDAGSVRFTVEKPDENFSCASSLSALALHEHYVQKDVELRLLPPACPDLGSGSGGGPGQHFAGHRRRDEANGREGPPATNQELELLRDCLGTAMPTRLCKVASALVPGRCALPVPVYMLVPAPVREDNSYTDLAEGTPVNFSVASLSDETLQGSPKELPGGRGDRQKPAGREAPTRQAAGHRHRVRGVGRSTEPARVTGRRRAGLELPLRRPLRACVDRDSPQAGRAHGEGTLQSLCLTTPTEETVYCFYSNGSDEEPSTAAVVAPSLWESAIPQAVKRERLAGRKKTQAVPKATVPARAQPSLIADETPPCYSLSSSTSSLSEPEPETGRIQAREPVVTKDPGLGGRNDGHPSPRAKVELLRRCIGSAMPRRRPQASDPKCRKPRDAQLEERPAEGTQEHGEEAAGSDHASDLDSVEWRAIQEGANSIVTWLHQAAVADTQEVSSESDSILSFVSGLSVGSTLQPSLHRKGRRPWAEGQVSSATRPEKRDMTLAQRSSSPCLPCGPEKLRGAQKTTSGVPAMLRGRTVIYVPSPASRAQPKGTTGPRTAQRKIGPQSPAQPAAPTKALGPGQQRSRSLHRPGKISELAALTPPQRSATPPARLTKTPSSSSSQTSPASQPLPRRSLPASQASGSLPSPGASRVPKTPMRTLLAKQHKTQKSPVRIPFMQKPTRRGPPPLARPTPEPGPRGQVGPKGCPSARGGRLGLVRMASARSSGSESSNCSGFRRQLTFIKESPGLLHRRHLEQLSSAEVTTSASQGSSPRRSRPTPPTVFLCSSRCKELRAPPPQALVPQRPLAARPSPTERPPRRTSSESPSRLPIRKQATQPEAVKRYASLPHISMARRPEGAAPGPEADAAHQSSNGEARPLPRVASPGTTWRRIRDEDVPHILRSTLPATALPLIGTSPEEHPGGPPQRKTSDAVVQTEDFSTTKTNSSTSPSLESREHPQALACRPASFLSSDVDRPGPAKGPTLAPFIHEGLGVAAGGFAASRHGSPSRSARVPPFNYVPSPMVVATTDSAVEKAPAPTDLLE